LVNGFIYRLYPRLGAISIYSAIVDLRNSQINTTHAEPFPGCYVFTSRSLATVSNNGVYTASRAQVLSSQLPVQNSTELISPTVLFINSLHGSSRKHRSSVVAFLSVAAGTCLPSCCSETDAAWTTGNTIQFLRALPSNGRCL
jgi:hypothetical protein